MTIRTPADRTSSEAGHPAYPSIGNLRRRWPQLRPVERVCYVVSAVLLTSGLFHLGVLLVTGTPGSGRCRSASP